MFTTQHFIWLALGAVAIPVMFALVKIYKPSLNLLMKITLFILAFFQLYLIFVSLIEVHRTSGRLVVLKLSELPLHLCDIQTVFILVGVLTKSKKVRRWVLEFMTPTCFVGAAFSLFIPTAGVEFSNPSVYQYFIYHWVIVAFGLCMVFEYRIHFGFKEYVQLLASLAILFVGATYANAITGQNFFFVSGPPMTGLPILNMDFGWGIYFLNLSIVAIIVCTLFCSPFFIYNHIVTKKGTCTNPNNDNVFGNLNQKPRVQKNLKKSKA